MEILITREAIDRRVDELAGEITRDYGPDADLILVGVLKGSFMFMSDLMRRLPIPHEVDFMSVSSYGDGTSSSGVVRLLKDLDTDVSGRDLLLVEDIVDSGRSLAYMRDSLQIRRPRSFRTCALLDKVDRREVDVKVDYVGFAIPDKFVVGYGMDYAERHRELPYIGVLDPAEAGV